MIIDKQKIKIKWSASNKKYYESIGYNFTGKNNEFEVWQSELMPTSRFMIIVKCDSCLNDYKLSNAQALRAKNHLCSDTCKFLFGKTEFKCKICKIPIFKNNTQIEKSVSGHHFCSNACVGKYNSLIKNEDLHKKCIICDNKFKVKKSTIDKQITCSRDCQAIWQSTYLVGENANNYKGGDVSCVCEYCNISFLARRYKKDTARFCSLNCSRSYWTKYTRQSDEFKEKQFKGTELWRKTKVETSPERMVREWLIEKNVEFLQEQGFFRKYIADFWIKNTKIIVEVFGDYWHANPRKYGEDLIKLNESQLTQIEKDKQRIGDFIKYGFQVIILWEDEIYENLDEVMKNRFLTIYPRNDYTQNIQCFLDEDIV